ncbi:MAG: hypothetical protein E7576_07175 [Ruminococcaceae bacterium]|nr:hypothetical protein [Oscillospiraceae bacterium]
MRTYTELIKLPTFGERFEYLKLDGAVAQETFGGARWLNQVLYQTPEWKVARRKAIVRDMGNDLGCEGWPILGRVYVHHMNPITKEDILKRSEALFDPENLICCSDMTHKAITYGDFNLLPKEFEERKAGDTCPWKKLK